MEIRSNEEGQVRDETRGKSSFAIWALSIFLVLYFIFPMVLMYPVFLVYGLDPPPAVDKALDVFFYPVIKLRENVPAYASLLQWEFGKLYF